MRITHFIKNYPIVIFSSIILIICFSLLAIPQKIYAQTKSSKNPNCDCITRSCPNNPKPVRACSYQKGWDGQGRCDCGVLEQQGGGIAIAYNNCDNATARKCVRIKGCSDCTPSDCDPNNPSTGDGICKNCNKYHINVGYGNCDDIQKGLDGEIISCGNCTLVETKENVGII